MWSHIRRQPNAGERPHRAGSHINQAVVLIVLGQLLCRISGNAADWPVLGHDPARSGATADQIRPPFERKWYRLFDDEGLQSGIQPVIARNTLFIGTMRGVFYAIDTTTGEDLWRFKAGGPILHSAAVFEGMVFFGCADGNLYALNATDSTLCWKFSAGPAIWNAPVVHAGLVYFGGRDGTLYALDVVTGQARWSAMTGAPVLNSPAIDVTRQRIYVGSEDMRVRAFRLSDGQAVWESEPLPGASFRGYHPVIAPDGSVLQTTQPVLGYDRFQELLLAMVKEVFGGFASWRHSKEENAKLRAGNFRLMENPATYQAQLDYLRRRLAEEPAFQTFFVLDPENGKQRFVAPIVASESMNGSGAPPVVTPAGRVVVKYQALLRSRYEHYSPFMNVGYLDTASGHIAPIMEQDRTYGWHDSLLLVHDEQCQLTVAGDLLINTHQDNVNALDLRTLKGFPEPFAANIHEPARGEALALAMEKLAGRDLSPGNEWLIRGTAVYGGGSVLDVPVVVSGDSFYYLPTHELNSGCALIAYRSAPAAASQKRKPVPPVKLSDDEWQKVQDQPWDWDTLSTGRLKNLLEALPGPVPGTLALPFTSAAERKVQEITDSALDRFISEPAISLESRAGASPNKRLARELNSMVAELISKQWRPLVIPAAKAPEDAYRFFSDPGETVYTILLALPFLEGPLRERADRWIEDWIKKGLPAAWDHAQGESRTPYSEPARGIRIVNDTQLDDLGRLYPIWLWSTGTRGAAEVRQLWPGLRQRLNLSDRGQPTDCGNSRLAGLIAYCRLARAAGDEESLARSLPLTRQAMRTRLVYELAHTKGGLIRSVPNSRQVFARWRNLTPDVAALVRSAALPTQKHLTQVYVDYHRPGWWIAWNVEQLMRNEAPTQLPSTPLEIFTARALIIGDSSAQLTAYLDIPWCAADEFYIRKLALTLRAQQP